MQIECEQCKKFFNKSPCHIKRVKRHFCSKSCFDEAQIKRITKKCIFCDTKFEIRPSMSNRYATCSSLECRTKKKSKNHNGNWRGGVTKSRKAAMSTKEYKAWRKAVFERDSYTCVYCGIRGGELNADHIKPWAYFPELRYDVSNGRTLCLDCHKTTYKEIFKWKKEKDTTQ